ncbi:MAG: YkgJ family cysteine cluster protein [Uliginosibacterium sp.]|jgi:Fe-S-cluster containining protein|nr:YkgJ family cysteine cluster protein [Uliginosibacterium sp.]
MSESDNPCLHCGACCSAYRVAFYWAESDAAEGGTVPAAMTVQINPWLVAMRGTHPVAERCVALGGEIGSDVSCAIYPLRASTCREFDIWAADGTINPHCTAARARYGLPALLLKRRLRM